jgi:hypothetical protein
LGKDFCSASYHIERRVVEMKKTKVFLMFFVLTTISFLAILCIPFLIKPTAALDDQGPESILWNELRSVQNVNEVDFFSSEATFFSKEEDSAAQPKNKIVRPNAYRVYSLNREILKNILDRAPWQFAEKAIAEETILPLPKPDGKIVRFRIEKTQILSPDLQSRYPGIHTYRARGIDDQSATASLDLTPFGFHAYVISDKGTFLVDPENPGDTGAYLTYWKHDVPGQPFNCLVGSSDPYHMQTLFEALRSPTNPSGDQLTTYRLAISVTGEYTQFFGAAAGCGPGSPANCEENAAAAQITTTVNRVSGIYEGEVAIRLNLVFMNIYDDPDTDPFTGDNVSVMRGENQTDLDTNLGSANYDIGHIFSAGGSGGIARLGVVCDNSFKAWGATSLGNPSGDVFDVDYVSHEMGHQFNGNHTWNGDTGSCSDSQFVADAAYEPGSGSTIMAYAGICSGQNVQPNSDAYFHTHSFDEITAFRDSSTCGTVTPTGNTVPIVDAGPDYTIPRDTPFKLTATGTDSDGDVITYNWEQFDLGEPRGLPSAGCTSCPLFRSRPATTSPSRTFPRIEDILSGSPTPWEVLPTIDRTLNFRVTARDNQASGGGVDYDAAVIAVIGDPFQIVSPSSGDFLECGAEATIAWNVGGGSVANDVRALYSVDGGTNFSELISSTPNNGSATAILPNTLTSIGRIKLEALGNIFFDISGPFTIQDTLAPLLTVPADLSVECTSYDGAEPNFGIATATDQCDDNLVIVNDAPANGSFPLGTTTITWNVEDDSGNTSTDSQQISVVDTTPPVIAAPGDILAECTSPVGTPVDIGTPAVSDICDSSVDIGNNAPGIFNIGSTNVTWTAADDSGNLGSDTQIVTIQDTTPPEFELFVTPDVFWPPNHKLVTVQAIIIVSDICDSSPDIRLVSITSSEPDNGLGDGDTPNDIQGANFGTDDREFKLRSERSGLGPGRVYTVVYEAEDDSGNITTREAVVSVPKNQT